MRRHARRLTLATVLAVGALVASTVVAAAPASAAATGAVAGTVRNADGGGLAGVVVTARTPGSRVLASTTTRADGSYTLGGVPTGLRSICFDGATATTPTAALGYDAGCWQYQSSLQFSTPVQVRAGRTVRGIDATLGPLAAVQGRVTTPTGDPAGGVAVRVLDSGLPTTTTDSDGRYRLTFVTYGPTTVRMCFDPAGVVPPSVPAGLRPACAPALATVGPGQLATVDQSLDRASGLVGRVTDAGGSPLAGVRIVIGQSNGQAVASTVTGTDGGYRVLGLPPYTDFVIGFDGRLATGGSSTTGYLSQCWDAPVTDDVTVCTSSNFPGRVLRLMPGIRPESVDGRLPPAGVLHGAVRDTQGRGIAGLRVIVRPDGGSRPLVTTSGPDGGWQLGGLRPADTYTVCADGQSPPAPVPQPDPDGYEAGCHGPAGSTSATPVTVVAGEDVGPVDVVLAGHGAIGGRVVDGSGRPVVGMLVAFHGPGETSASGVVHTGADGRFRIGGLPVSVYDVCLSADAGTSPHDGLGFGPLCRRQLAVTDGVTLDLADLAVVEGGVITGQVADAAGYPLAGWYMTVTDLATGTSTFRRAPMMSSGAYTTDVLAPGRYSVCVVGGQRVADGSAPPRGFAVQCWRQQVDGATPTPVRVGSGRTVTGIDFRLRANPG